MVMTGGWCKRHCYTHVWQGTCNRPINVWHRFFFKSWRSWSWHAPQKIVSSSIRNLLLAWAPAWKNDTVFCPVDSDYVGLCNYLASHSCKPTKLPVPQSRNRFLTTSKPFNIFQPWNLVYSALVIRDPRPPNCSSSNAQRRCSISPTAQCREWILPTLREVGSCSCVAVNETCCLVDCRLANLETVHRTGLLW